MRRKVLLIGARGVGKSALIKRWQKFSAAKDFEWLDLDQEVEKVTGQSIASLFQIEGESAFRHLEMSLLNQFLRSSSAFVIAVGAGFDWSRFQFPIPRDEIEVIWLRRASDVQGRIFLDRPRLDPHLDPLDEYNARHSGRFAEYERQADWIYEMPEGLFSESRVEIDLLESSALGIGGCFTLQNRHRTHRMKLESWHFDYLEIRDDIWSAGEAAKWREVFPTRRMLWAARNPAQDSKFLDFFHWGDEFDWALELGPPKDEKITIISSHGPDAPVDPENHRHLKWSPLVETWEQIRQGWKWQQEDPKSRSYLPRSSSGRWQWFRALMKGRQKLNFVREFQTQAADQPSLSHWLRTPEVPKRFAAVLGSPVSYSWSPITHADFFGEAGLGFFAIDLQREEFATALSFLQELGLVAAAVTSPLKKLAYDFAGNLLDRAKDLQSVNTLWLEKGIWQGENTDLMGLQKAASLSDFWEPIFIWGGGGTLSSINAVFPEATEFSARTGKARERRAHPRIEVEGGSPAHEGKTQIFPQTVVWAASPRDPLPPADWRPKVIFDLNYVENSRAREWAMKVGARYISGQSLFYGQAQAQQSLWKSLLATI